MIIKRYVHMTLIEVLIALSLLVALLSALMGFYYQIELFERKIAQQKQEYFRDFYTQYRLGQIIPKILDNFPLDKNVQSKKLKKFYLYTTGKDSDLVFVFDNEIDGSPLFSNRDIGKLYVNPQKQLCLAIWPAPIEVDTSNPPMRHEVLLENVTAFNVEFYLPTRQNIDEKPVDPVNEQYHGRWLDISLLNSIPYTSQQERELPVLLKLQIKQNEKLTILPFLLINAGQHINFSS